MNPDINNQKSLSYFERLSSNSSIIIKDHALTAKCQRLLPPYRLPLGVAAMPPAIACLNFFFHDFLVFASFP